MQDGPEHFPRKYPLDPSVTPSPEGAGEDKPFVAPPPDQLNWPEQTVPMFRDIKHFNFGISRPTQAEPITEDALRELYLEKCGDEPSYKAMSLRLALVGRALYLAKTEGGLPLKEVLVRDTELELGPNGSVRYPGGGLDIGTYAVIDLNKESPLRKGYVICLNQRAELKIQIDGMSF